VSVTQQSVSFSPAAKVSRVDIHNALADAGFEVECESGTASSSSSLFGSALQARWRKRTHLRNCEACKDGRSIPLEPVPETVDRADTYNLAMSIGGMTCAACVSAIIDALREIDGVSELNIDLLGRSGSAILSRRETAEDIKNTIDDIGYECEIVSLKLRHDAELKQYKAVLGIRGMTSTSCELTISRALNSLESVHSVDVNFWNESAEVVFTLSVAEIKCAVEESGYDHSNDRLTKI
jgi:copper ion binding protein